MLSNIYMYIYKCILLSFYEDDVLPFLLWSLTILWTYPEEDDPGLLALLILVAAQPGEGQDDGDGQEEGAHRVHGEQGEHQPLQGDKPVV